MAHKNEIPDSTAVRVALWRALHTEVDSAPHILEDQIGLKLIAPDKDWRTRGDMNIQGTSGYRASIVGRSRFIEDLVLNKIQEGIHQYVILGAGIDTFAQRKLKPDLKLTVFEVDKPDTQTWKKNRLTETGYAPPKNLKFVGVDFETTESWLDKLKKNGFQENQPAIIASTGVSMYLTKETIIETLRQISSLAPTSIFVMTFLLTLDLIDPKERAQHEMVYEKARASGTPFISFFSPQEILELALKSGFKKAEHVSRDKIIKHYFANRSDGLMPGHGEEFLVATT